VQSELVTVLGGSLQPVGFRRRRANWYCAATHIYSIVGVQESAWGDGTCYVNLGLNPSDRVSDGWWPERRCVVRFRIDALRSTHVDDLKLLHHRTLEAIGLDAWRLAVEERIAAPTAQLLRSLDGPADIRRLLRHDLTGQRLVTVEGRQWLQLP
jgi:hypothetical protein